MNKVGPKTQVSELGLFAGTLTFENGVMWEHKNLKIK